MNFEEAGKKVVSSGPWGGQGGSLWDDGAASTIRQIVICHGAGIDAIQFEYDKKGTSFWSEKHGGTGATKTDRVNLDYPAEYLTSIRGHYGSLQEWRGPLLVRSLTFQTNRKTYGPFGVELGSCFSSPAGTGSGSKIVGFHGRAGWFLDAIGVYSKPIHDQKQINPAKTDPIQRHNYLATNATHNSINGFSVLQGSVGQNYDIVLAVRQRDDFGKPIPAKTPGAKILDYQADSDSEHEVEQPKSKMAVKFVSKVEGVVTYGPWGGNGGTVFDDGAHVGIRQITVSRNVGIVYIKVLYDCDGEPLWGNRQGSTGGFKHDKIIFDYPSEILTHITGHYGPVMYMGPSVIRSLTFHTTKGKHGPFGEEVGTPFSTKLKEGKIVGFHGRKGLFLDAIGVHVIEGKVTPTAAAGAAATTTQLTHSKSIVLKQPQPQQQPPISQIENPQWSHKLVLASKQTPSEGVACGVVKEPAPCGPGPWGGEGGRPWDDGVFSGIKQIYIMRSIGEGICSIQIEYDRNGQSVWSVKHGGNSGTSIHRLKLEYPHEVLSCISGYYGPISSRDERSKVVKSLTFFTSRGKYGPFGEEIGTFFTSTTTEGKVVGFHGRSSLYLDAIGVHMQHWLGNQKNPKSSLFKLF